MLEKLGGRKMIIGLLGLIALTLLSSFKPEAVTAQFVTALLGIIAAFNVANVTNTIKTAGLIEPEDKTLIIDETKAIYLNLQDQIDASTKQINTMADIIQKSILTQAANSRSINTQGQMPVGSGNNGEQQPQANLNRQAISQYLSEPFKQS